MTDINAVQQVATASILLARLLEERGIDTTDSLAIREMLEAIAPPPDGVDYTYLVDNIVFVSAILRYKANRQ